MLLLVLSMAKDATLEKLKDDVSKLFCFPGEKESGRVERE